MLSTPLQMWALRTEISQRLSAGLRFSVDDLKQGHMHSSRAVHGPGVVRRKMGQNLGTRRMQGLMAFWIPRVIILRGCPRINYLGKCTFVGFATHYWLQSQTLPGSMLTWRFLLRKYANDFWLVEKISPEVMVLLPIRTLTEQSRLMFFLQCLRSCNVLSL